MFIKFYLFYLLISFSPPGRIKLMDSELENANGIQSGKTESLMKEDSDFLKQVEQKYERDINSKEFNCTKMQPSFLIWKKEKYDGRNCKKL